MIRFLHTADLHLGKPFGRFPEELRGRLREARHATIARLAAAARAHGAADILVAGDSFDSQTPAPATLRQALHAMAADPGLRW
jgi:DNA repair exonuclease SbcCD nuclease subunit